ncbi:Hsp33 family molecular chaperone HslO [Undibacterium sp. CCC3.4]|uniref:Hsp33 family molecular chaperone HslO n=1 Tax=unclassified Undibacterium TaxID=2630295 RepID=UPI003A101532
MTDTLQKFMFENAGVRGELVELENAWQQMLEHQTYPPAVRNVLGELMAAAALLSANLKFNGTMIMQIHGDGPVRLMVVECDAELRLRATAKLADDAVIGEQESLRDLVHAHGQGRFVITLDPNDKMPGQQAYQGIVPLDGDSIAAVIENYMLRSEQLDTKLWLAADDKVARGLLLQKLPETGGSGARVDDGEDLWGHAVLLGDTLKREELLSTDSATLMHRLFWEQTLRVFDPLTPQFYCSCTREKVGDMLKMLGTEEVESALNEIGRLDINCDFCGKHYGFDPVDCAQLFVAKTLTEGLSPAAEIKH